MKQQVQNTNQVPAPAAVPKPTGADIRKLIREGAQEFPILGFVVWWSISGFRVPHGEFVRHLQALDIDTKLYGKKATDKAVLTQAVKEEIKGSRRTKYHKKIKDDDKTTTFGIQVETIDTENTNVEASTETKIIMEKGGQKSGAQIKIEGPGRDAILKRVSEFNGTYTGDQFRLMIRKFIELTCQGVGIRDRGGVYFVPVTNETELRKIEQLAKFLPDCATEIVPVTDLKEAKRTMYKAFVLDFNNEIAAFSKELDSMQAGTVGKRLLANRIEEFKALRAKAEMYGDLFQTLTGELIDKVNGLEKRVKAKLNLTPSGE